MIVERCDGLPLAAETLGRLLHSEHRVEEWKKILSSDIWEFPLVNCKIVPALLISYYHLPAHLKSCFVYCSLYPKDHKFDKNELTLLWMAEDLLQPPTRGETLEEVGCKCFDELASRLFFKLVQNDYEKYFVMHDLMHDLATFLAGKFYCRLLELGENEEMGIQTRHLSWGHRISEKTYSSSKIKCLRTILNTNHDRFWMMEEIISRGILLSTNKYLRVLFSQNLGVFPDSIGKLIHLRYLNLSRSNFKVLPESLCNLFNLQTLKLESCSNLTMLPNGMYNLLNLRHLDIRDTPLKEMPKGMGKLNQLHILSYYIVGKQEDNGIQELGGLSNLHGSFKIQKLENVADVIQARSARIIEKKHIDKLLLEWSLGDDTVSDIQIEGDVLNSLRPHTGLKELRIEGYKGKIFPDWFGQYSYNNMTYVSLRFCKNCCTLPSLGQLPFLKSLWIQYFDQLTCIGDEFYKNDYSHTLQIAPFPSLETLYFHDMPCWELWNSPGSEAFPQLKKLEITQCPMLRGDMVNQILMRMVSSSSDVSKIRNLNMKKYFVSADYTDMSFEGDSLSLWGCEWLVESTFMAMFIRHLTSLQEIIISGFSSAASFPAYCLPKSLQKLEIQSCTKLEFLEQQQEKKYDLVELLIHSSCDSLASLSLDAFPNLKDLRIELSKNLESISISELPHTALQSLTIDRCPKLVSITEGGLAAPNLTHLHVSFCPKLKALPRNMDTLLPNLQSLDIEGCRGICGFPKGGLPPNLEKLRMKVHEGLLRGLYSTEKLEALKHLVIDGWGCERVNSFPEVSLLPHLASLTTLEISWFRNLETLECNELLHLTSLQHFHSKYCRKLENMAGEKLPSSLLLLEIEGCPLLEEGCKNKHQHIWPKIQHIPTIKVNGHQIF